jgi:predicted nucleotidyltransferase
MILEEGNMKSLKDVNEILKEHKEELFRKYSVVEIGVFGSFVRGEEKKRSDIDILVEFEKVPDLLEFIALEEYLRKLLKKKVDLVRKEGVRHELKDRILQEVVYI